MVQHSTTLNATLLEQIDNFCRHLAGSCQITCACVCGNYAVGASAEKAVLEVLLIIRDFPPRLMNYVKVLDDRNIVVFAVDQWVFERDVEKGFLGEALAGALIFPYTPLINADYLHDQEVKLKKRLILELLKNLVLDFPELSYEIHIRPEYFLYESMLSRARLFPLTIYDLANFMQEDAKKENIKHVLSGYLEALKQLEEEKIITTSNGYIRITQVFAENARSKKTRFINLFKTAQRTLFTSLLSVFPKTLDFISQNKELSKGLLKIAGGKSKAIHQIENPKLYLLIPTASGLVPLANKLDIGAFARKALSKINDAEVKVEQFGGILNDVYLIKAYVNNEEKKVIAKRFRDWSSFKWFPLTLWAVGTRTFAVSGRSRLERECAINQFLHSKGFPVPKILHVSHNERLLFMEYVDGENLDKIIKKIVTAKAQRGIEKELSIIAKVGETFANIHALDISLGDTKPENILVGKSNEIVLLDFEQASRNGDKVWDIAEFLYYAGHYIPPFVGTRSAELIAEAFIQGYLKAGGDPKIVKAAGNPKYTKVFSVFTFPHIMFAMSNVCRRMGKGKG